MDLVNNMFIGVAYGDAAGAPFETLGVAGPSKFKYDGTFSQPRTYSSRYNGDSVTFEPGFVTDDTSMCFEARRLVASGWTRENAVATYQRWAAGPYGRFMGKNTRSLFAGVTTLKGYETRVQKQDGEKAQGNGCLMRTPAFASQPTLPESIRLARHDCFLTNPNKTSLTCSDIQCMMLFMALKRCSPEHIWRTINTRYASFGPIESAITGCDLVQSPFSPSKKETKGWVSVALFCSVWTLKQIVDGCDPEETLTYVVNCSLDSDTTGSIAAALIGALGFQFNKENVKIMTDLSPWIIDERLPITTEVIKVSHEDTTKLCTRREMVIKSLIKSIASDQTVRDLGICADCSDLSSFCSCE